MKIKDIIKKIDITRLRRDYSKEPLKTTKNGIGSEFLTKDEIEYLYIELNLRKKDISKFCGISFRKLSFMMTKLKIHKNPILNLKLRQETCIQKYGVSNPNKTKEVRNKIENTCMIRYGEKCYSKTSECKKRVKETNLKNCGFENNSQSPKWKENIQKNKEEINKKIYLTKKKNGSLGKSKIEDKIYEILLTKFPNAIHHPEPSEKYPFQCDFYIPELDLYIEYQGYGSHGGEPFNSNNPKHINLVNKWKQQAKEINFKGEKKTQFNIYIKVWTQDDTLKRETARKNKLNWIEFFNIKQFMEWFEKQ